MVSFVEPEVYFIGSSQMTDKQEESLGAYLREVGAEDWESNAGTPEEELMEVGGRICYNSFIAGKNLNVTRVRDDNKEYLRNIIKSKHGRILEHVWCNFLFHNISRVLCYSPDCEIYTISGWKNITELTVGEQLLTKDPISGLSRFQENKKLHMFSYEGEMYSFENSQVKSPLLTPDHLMWSTKTRLRRFLGLSNKEIAQKCYKVPIKELYGSSFIVDSAIKMENSYTDDIIKIGEYSYDTRDLLFWLGLVSTDGGLPSDRKNEIRIFQSKEDNLSKIRLLMKRLFLERWREHGSYKTSDNHIFCIVDKDLADWVRFHINIPKRNRIFSPWLCHTISSDLLHYFIRGVILGDGNIHRENNHEVIYCCNSVYAGQLQIMLSRLGYSSNIRLDDRSNTERVYKGKIIRNNIPSWIVSIHKKSELVITKTQQRKEYYKGEVYCPQTEDGIIYVRRNGIAFWCGNTHELITHKAGTSQSQESLRFVRLDKLRAYMPKVFKDYGLTAYFTEKMVLMETWQTEMAALFNIDKKSFEEKKLITSAMRRLSPQGLCTVVMWTANLRSIRHILEQRTNKHAEEEIRLLFDKVGRIMLETYPNLFFDFSINENGEWVPEYSKV